METTRMLFYKTIWSYIIKLLLCDDMKSYSLDMTYAKQIGTNDYDYVCFVFFLCFCAYHIPVGND